MNQKYDWSASSKAITVIHEEQHESLELLEQLNKNDSTAERNCACS